MILSNDLTNEGVIEMSPRNGEYSIIRPLFQKRALRAPFSVDQKEGEIALLKKLLQKIYIDRDWKS